MSGAELLAEPSCLGTVGIDVEVHTDILGTSVLAATVVFP